MIEHLLIHLGQYLFGLSEERRMEANDRKVERNARRRLVAHADIPPLEAVERTQGPRFDELLMMLIEADPVRLHTRRSRNARDRKQQPRCNADTACSPGP